MPSDTTRKARQLRLNATEAEKRLWQYLRADQFGVRFRRQFPLGPYIVDFACPIHKLIVELDGGQHAERLEKDTERSTFLGKLGYTVLRFWNNDVLQHTETIVEQIRMKTTPPLPGPLPPDGVRGGDAAASKKSGLDKIRIHGGRRLQGAIPVSGAKNAALPLMCAALLSDEPLQLNNMPVTLGDIGMLAGILEELGVRVALRDGSVAVLHAREIESHVAPYEMVRKMRASILVLGPLLARCGKAEVSLPGGCAIGTRPVDLHIDGLRALGAEIVLEDGYVKASAPRGLHGTVITFPKVSVGATENIMMAASLAEGETVLNNAAKEPEIVDLGECLIRMGAEITGLGTDSIRINGVPRLHGTTHAVIPDRIETGTWMIAAALTGGALRLQNARLSHLMALIEPLEKAGLEITQDGPDILVGRHTRPLTGTDIMTQPFPGFPTDLQAQFMTMLTLCMGAGMVTETIFENRFMHVPELARMGADITVHNGTALVRGVPKLKGAEVMATDLRASVALVLAGLVAEGTTTVNRIYHLDRGYENIVEKLCAVGADIERIPAEA